MTNNTKFISLSDVEALEVEWLWEPLIPFGMITIMEGDPGVGKSYLAMHLAAQITTGGELPENESLDKGRVLYLSAEDDAAYTIRPRIDAMGGDPSRIRIQADYLSLDEKGLEALKREVNRKQLDLIIIDPLFAYIPGDRDMYKPNVIRELLSLLKDIASKGETAILIIRHLTKAKHAKAIYQGGGSMDVIGAARSAFRVEQDPDKPNVKLVLHIKHNIAVQSQTWSYELIPSDNENIALLNWLGASELTIDDLSGSSSSKSSLEIAVNFLKDQLSKKPKPSKLIYEEGKMLGISKRTIDRARSELGVKKEKTKKGWSMSLPDK